MREGGPLRYGLHRLLIGCGHDCIVVAPSLSGEDEGSGQDRSARWREPAKLHRVGELTAVWVTNIGHRRCAIWFGPGSMWTCFGKVESSL